MVQADKYRADQMHDELLLGVPRLLQTTMLDFFLCSALRALYNIFRQCQNVFLNFAAIPEVTFKSIHFQKI